MAKYVISSIPASLPKNKDGGLFRKKKKKKLNSMMDYNPPTDESTLVRGIEPQNTFGNYFNSPGIPTSDYKPYNIGEQYNTRVRSELEKVPLTDRAAKELRRCDPNNPYSVWYNGKCMTEEEYLPLYIEEDQKEREDDESKFNASTTAFWQKMENTINAERKKSNEMYDQWESEHYDAYTNTFKNSKKFDKIEPYDRIPAYTLDDLTQYGITKRELYKNQFYMSENKETGMIDLYVKDMMKSRIINNGFRTKQFVDTWGLDKDQVDKELGSFMKYADQLYNENRTAEILKLARKKNITIEAAARLIPTSVGSQKYINENITDPLNEQIDENFQEYIKTIRDGIGPYKKTNTKQKVNYNFNDDIYDTKEKDGIVISHDFNSIRQYTKAWVKAGKDDKEKKSRQAKVDEILKREYPEVYKKLDENPIYQGHKDEISTLKQSQLSDHVYVNPDIMKHVTNKRRSDAYDQEAYQRRDSDLADLTGYADDFNIYTQNLMQKQLYDLSVDALKTNNFSSLDKLKFIEGDNDYKEGRIYGDEYKKKIADLFSYDRYVERVTSPYQIRPGKSTTPLSLSEKIHDVATNPFVAYDYWMNPRTQMWPDNATSDQGYEDRKKIEKKWQNYGLDLGTFKPTYNRRGLLEPSITGLFNFFGQPFNPAKIATDVYGGYEKNGWSGAGEELANAGYEIGDRVLLGSTFGASALSKMKYLRNLSNLNKASQTASRFGKFNIGLQKITNLLNSAPLTAHISAGVKDYMKVTLPVMTFDAVRPGGNFNQAYNDFSKGDNWYGVGNLGLGALGVLPYGIKGFNALRTGELTPGLRAFYPEGTQFARNTEQFRQLTGLQTPGSVFTKSAEGAGAIPNIGPKYYKSLFKQVHPDVRGGSKESSQLLQDIYTGKGFQNVPFNAGMQTGIISPKYQFGRWSAGKNVFQPKTLEELLQIQNLNNSSINRGLQLRQQGGSTHNPIINSLRQLGSLNNFEKGGDVPTPPKWLAALLKKGASMGSSFKNLFTVPASVKKAFGYIPPVIPTLPSKTQLIDEVLNGQQLSGLTDYGSLLDNIDPGGQTLENSFYRDIDAKSKKGFKADILETLSKARDNSLYKYPNLVDVKDTDFTTESPFWMNYANLANFAKTGVDFSYIKPKMITDADYFTFQDLKKQFHGQKKWHIDMMDFKSIYHTKKQKDELREKLKEFGLPYETDQDLFESLYKSRPQDFSSKMYKINHLDFLKKTGRYDYLKAISKGEFDSDFPLSFDLKHKYSFSDNVDKLPFWHDQSLKVDDNYISYLNDATTHRDLVDLTTAFDPWWAEGLPKDYYHRGLAGMTDFNTEKSLLLKFIQLKYGKKRTEEKLDYQNPKHKYHPLITDPRGWDPKYLNKTGGVIKNSLTSKKNSITMNLSKSEINKYIAGGYIIEDV